MAGLEDTKVIGDERKFLDEKVNDKKDEKKVVEKEEEETPEEEVKEEETEEETPEEETDEQAEGEEEEEEKVEEEDETDETDEELENDSVYQQLKKRDPKILKEIPELRSVIFREQKYTELFPSIEEAKTAREQAEVFSNYERDMMSGNSENLLEALNKSDKKSLEAFVANFIPTVEKQSKDLYLGMIYPEFKKMLRAALKSEDERLITSAKNLNWFVFGDTNVDADAGLKPAKKDDRDEEISKREQAMEERLHRSFAEDVGTTADKRLRGIARSAFKDSDMSALLQNSLTDEIVRRVDKLITQDARHMGNINHLWVQARRAGFTTEWKDRIISAYLSRAKVLTPKIRQQVLSEAKVSSKSSGEPKKEVKRISSGGALQKGSGKTTDPSKVDWSKTSERDFLEGKAVLKG